MSLSQTDKLWNEPWTKADFVTWVKATVNKITPGSFPMLNYRLTEPLVRPFDPKAADMLAALQAHRLQEKVLVQQFGDYLKTRLDGK